MRLDVIALTVLFTFILWFMYRRNRLAIKRDRAALFDACRPLLESYRIVQDDVDFPTLTGLYRGYAIEAEPLVDHLGFRKIPSLWLKVTVKCELPIDGTFDLLVRPQNIEFFSPAAELPENILTPEGWPAHAVIKGDRPAGMPRLALLEPHVLSLFADAKAKELLVTPRGVRIVYQVNQVQRGEYLVLRALTFADVALPPFLFGALLDRAVALCDDLTAAHGHSMEQSDAKVA